MPSKSPIETIPLREDASGTLRVGGTRVLLELVLEALEDGATPEAIAQRFDTLSVSDINAVITYAERHPDEIADYRKRRDRRAAEVWEKIEANRKDLGEIRRRVEAGRKPVE